MSWEIREGMKNKKFFLFNPKTINVKYIEFVLASPSFMQEFTEFINCEFKGDY